MRLKLVAGGLLAGALTIGGAGVAAAASPVGGSASPSAGSNQTGTKTFNCANAPKALAHLAKADARAEAFITKAEARETKAKGAGHTKAAARIADRIQQVQKLEARDTKRVNKINALCPGAVPAGGTTSGGTAS